MGDARWPYLRESSMSSLRSPTPPENVTKVFEPFWRRESSEHREGLGLGAPYLLTNCSRSWWAPKWCGHKLSATRLLHD
jgi:hypothetical protein